ncbi:hypothetical protein SBOR_4091 [Sclerotinia borealis F-4128]|uniref:2EXR domain-containing protein n=1 Tax=Sclerotinia borealis (strain F-4128) TaxID=1432307 RepID=W9CI12_SCLBF|nr:hypothetical protein SBOR_4091 [Sclerotinia borealis F-4128]
MDTFQDLANMTLDVEIKTETANTQQSQALAPSQGFKRSTLFSRFPVEIRRKIWGFTVAPRLVEEKFCRMPGNGDITKRCFYNVWEPSIPRHLFPINIVPYNSMPAAFWACKESRNEIARYYHSIAIAPEDRVIERDLLLNNVPLPKSWQPWRVLPDRDQQWLIQPWAVKRIQITPRSLLSRTELEADEDLFFERDGNLEGYEKIFFSFVFQDLEEFIVQDFDCKLSHKLDSLANRDAWKEMISRMFRVESSHNEFEVMRAGSQFKVPNIEIRPGAKIARPCEDCMTISKIIKAEKKDARLQRDPNFEDQWWLFHKW